ncbi:coronin-7-like [Mercenaria mercenaria]|uniref:coronin-7-like n=1 Tax=Mercenaria mercenaria TaxID=6596 RepID=UPI00234F065F|nr:coronin-7-like [Mercenaria mercenaria]XP_053400008.1 coronin-7-like [Mercenaria mercenaria]XP_053400009.1 coronin-7-like [Mercenaria mercenaria]
MAWRFKVSKYKNAAPRYPKREEWINEVPVGMLMHSCGNHIAASCQYIAFNVDTGGGGNVGILPLETTGRVGQSLPTLRGHGDFVTDMKFSPFHDEILATCSADDIIKVWNLPETERLAEEIALVSHTAHLPEQERRIETLAWNTVADDILAAAVGHSAKLFDVSVAEEIYDISSHEDQILSLGWHGNGSVMVTTCKDKKIRVLDPRSKTVAQECMGHNSNKDSRAIFLGDKDFIVSTGFSLGRSREVKLFDSRNLGNALTTDDRDNNNGTLMPLLDEDTNMLLLVGKGDTTWSFVEVSTSEPYFTQHALERTEKNEQIKGACLIPKLGVNVMEGEVDRLLLLLHNTIVPLPYIVPRRQYKDFHADLFPDTKCEEPALTSDQWCSGQNAQVAKTSLDPIKRGTVKILRRPDKELRSKLKPQGKSGDDCTPIQKTKVVASSPTKTSSVTTSIASKPTKPAHTSKSAHTSKPVDPPEPVKPAEPSKAAKSFAALHQSKCKYMKGVSEHASKHIVNIRRLCRTLPGQSDLFVANTKRCAIPLEGSGGLVAILELDKPGRLPDTGVPVIQNGSKVNDFVFDPFDDTRILVGCDNARIFIWTLPADGLTETLTEYDSYLMSHTEKVYFVRFHPLAKDVIMTGSYDMKIKLWDLSDNTEEIELTGHQDEIFCAEWSPDGKLIATVCKDGKVRIYDPRTSPEPIKEGTGPEGSRGARVIWAVNMKYLVVSGFEKNSARLISVYDANNLGKPIHTEILDINPAILIPHYDEGTSTVFLTGRGDGAILGYEVSDEFPHLFALATTKPEGVHQGIALMPKTTCDVRKVEIARLWRLTQTTVEPMSFTVPRVKPEYFQDDLFPDVAPPGKPTMTSQEWFRGGNKQPAKISLRPADMKPLSEAPVEAPKAKKYDSYNPETYKTDDMKKEELISAMTNKLDTKEEPLPQDEAEGVDSDEWDEY